MKIVEKISSFFLSLHNKSMAQRVLILGQFFLIIFVYHLLKDLKDTLVITAGDAGAEVIPFLKIWGMLPLAIIVSYLFSVVYQRYGREKTLYLFTSSLLFCYAIFAFFLAPYSKELYLENVAVWLKDSLPEGCKGLISMLCHWIYTLFYLSAELWSMILLSVLFWGYVNEETSLKDAKKFYPTCMFVGNCAGIISGQSSYFICRSLMEYVSWHQNLQIMISLVIACGIGIMAIGRRLARLSSSVSFEVREKASVPFKESLVSIVQSPQLFCIAFMVVGYGLTSNLFEVIWKQSIKDVYPEPHNYNAYMNQLTSLIGMMAVVMALLSRWIFKEFSWSAIALTTPVALLAICSVYYTMLHLPGEHLATLSGYFYTEPAYLVMTVGAFYYVFGLTAKYTIFDMSKEMAFISLPVEVRTRSKAIIDSIGSRLGKSGASSFYHVLLIGFGSTAGHISFVAMFSMVVMTLSICFTKKLGDHLSNRSEAHERLAEGV